jgi:hypothetical protein
MPEGEHAALEAAFPTIRSMSVGRMRNLVGVCRSRWMTAIMTDPMAALKPLA